jgi:hypothetical protein
MVMTFYAPTNREKLSALNSCCYTTLRRVSSPDEPSNNLNNIKWMEFYH